MNEKILIVEDEFIVASDLTDMMESAGYEVCATADTVASAIQAIKKHQPSWVLLDILLQDDSMGTELAPYLQEKGIGFIYISANTDQSVLEAAKATQPYGFLVKPFREKDLLLMMDIARSKHQSIQDFAEQREALLQQGLWSLTDENTPYESKLEKTPAAFQSLIPFDLMTYSFQPTDGTEALNGAYFRIGFNEYQTLPGAAAGPADRQMTLNERPAPEKEGCRAEVFSGAAFPPLSARELSGFNQPFKRDLRSALTFTAESSDGRLRMAFFGKRNEAYDHKHIKLLLRSEKSVIRLFRQLFRSPPAGAVNTFRRAARIPNVKPQIKFEGIAGRSAPLLHLLDNVELVAGTDVSVLLLGETGTGKEKIAKNIHLLSSRRTRPFITINCAAMPANLVESELFGFEAGAFTGATGRRIGKFEAADGGTIFLDEIGELPLESQVKLLRVLQEKQLEKLGSSKTIPVDVRIIAATNRNLEQEVGEGRFRLDLFYRLNVFPLTLPPLRERGEDILILARYFLEKSAAALGREFIPELSAAAEKQLCGHSWPGNIRELEHLVERTLIKTKDPVIGLLELPGSAAGHFPLPFSATANKTLQEMETEYILSVLKICGGKINGPGGAAAILGLPASTLNSKMKKLGIRRTLNHDN
jgi:DNA-binding NtrC family response regulator